MIERIRLRPWADRWRDAAPLFVAEFIIWLGFGALLPILPLWVTDHGVDLATMGVIVAAWPVSRLVGEPAFGWLADRTARKPLMVAGLLATSLFTVLQVWLVTPVAFFLLRGLMGLATSAYDPSARGYLSDATSRDRQGEAFGLFGSAGMGGLILGPAIGGIVAAVAGSYAPIFVVTAAACAIATIPIVLLVHERPSRRHVPALGPAALSELPPDDPGVLHRAVTAVVADDETEGQNAATDDVRPASLRNRALGGAVVINLGENYAVGTYEVIWSLWLVSLGAGVDLIGLTFAMFGIPVLILSPLAGRLVDRGRTVVFIVAASVGLAVSGILYGLIEEPLLVIGVIAFEGTCVAFLTPALFAVVASGSPRGRSSTAQGIYGAAGTVGFIVASLATGAIASVDLRLPFFVFSAIMAVMLLVGLAIGRDRLSVRPSASR
jgi:MFS family permease